MLTKNHKADHCQCSVQEAVYWYSVTPKDGVESETAPANALYYEVWVKGVDKNAPLEAEPR